MENLKKKLKNIYSYLRKILRLRSKKLIGILSNHFGALLLGFVVMLTFGSISYASEEESDKLLDTFFNYADSYYDVDFTGNTSIHTIYLQNYLNFIHFNKQTIKSKFYSFKNLNSENLDLYSSCNSVSFLCFGPYNSFLSLNYCPNTSNANNYAFSEYDAQAGRNYANYNQPVEYRLTIQIQNNQVTDISYVNYGQVSNGVRKAALGDGTWSEFIVILKDDEYYTSVPNFNGNASYFVNYPNSRLNGQSDFGFFNINYNDVQRIEVDEDIVFGDLYVGYNYSLNNQTIYLYNETTSQIMDNEIDLISTSGLYNGRYHYQVVTDDLRNLNQDHQYSLVCSSSSSLLAGFVSSKFRFSFNNEELGQELPTLIILSGDYSGVGSGEGFNNAINDINNNLGVISGQINKTNKNINDIKDYITDSSSPDDVFNLFFSGDKQSYNSGDVLSLAYKFGFSELTNNYYALVDSILRSVYDRISVNIPNYDEYGVTGPSISVPFKNKIITFYTKDFNPFHLNDNMDQQEQYFYGIRFIIGMFSNGICAYLFICWFASFIIKLQSFNLNAVKELDTDVNLF